MRDLANVEQATTPRTRMFFCETPSNPMMFLADLRALGDMAQALGVLLVGLGIAIAMTLIAS